MFKTTISGLKITNFGAHCDSYNTPYLTAAASIGMTKTDVDIFVTRLDKVYCTPPHFNCQEMLPLSYQALL
jgi:O-phospho-L-seryl-tRNASec:L-selenocysteinyl-tRNA synthase